MIFHKCAFLVIVAVFCIGSASTVAQQPENTGTPVPATLKSPALIKLIGKSRVEVEAALGKTTNVAQPTSGGVCLSWGEYPTGIGCIWNKAGKMTVMTMPPADTWRKTLKKYGISASGVSTKQIKGKGGATAYKLIGVAGIPAGWSCKWFDDSFTLYLTAAGH